MGSSPSSTRHIKEKENVQTCDHTCVFFLSFSRVGRSKTLRRFHWWRSTSSTYFFSLSRSARACWSGHQWVSFSWSCFQPCISTSTISWASSPREGNESRDRKIIRSSFFLSSYCSLARERWKEKRWSWSFPGFPSLAAVIFLLAERKKEKKRPTEWRWRQWWLLFDRLKALLSQEKIKEKVGQAVSVSRAYCGPHESASSAGPQF